MTYERPAADIILPEQFFPARSALAEPECRLRLAVLEHAVRSYQQYDGTGGRRAHRFYEDAAEWFASPDRSEPFSFENVCEALGLDPDAVRRRLQRWRDTAARRAA